MDYFENVITFVVLFQQNSLQGSVLVGSISYGKLLLAGQMDRKYPEKHLVWYRVSCIIPQNKVILYLMLLPALMSFSVLYDFTQHVPHLNKHQAVLMYQLLKSI